MEIGEAIRTRKTVRNFTGQTISDEQIEDLLDAARRAPSWANTQCWQFIVIRDQEIRGRVVDCFSPTNPARKGAGSAAVFFAVLAEKKRSGYGKDGAPRTRFLEWALFDLGMAVQNLSLAAHAMGLGSVVVGSMDHGALDAILNVPETHECVVIIPVGVPAEGETVPVPRKGIDSIAWRDRFGTPWKS